MQKKILVIVGLAIVLISAKPISDKYFEITKGIEIYANVYKALNSHFVDELDPSSLMKTGIDAMTASLDPYTRYISEADVENYRLTVDGKYDGIGARVMNMDDFVTISYFYKDSPAAKAGIQVGDQILSINGKDMKGKKAKDVTRFMRGAPNSVIDIKVRNLADRKIRNIKVERGEIHVPNVPYYGMLDDHVGYISLTTFTKGAGKNVRSALKALKAQNDLKGVVLDLRGNGGGLLYEAVAVCNVFVPKGEEVVFTKGKLKESYKNYKTFASAEDAEIPLAVLVNDRSASASEIVSGVVQDLDRGVLIGQRTYGKGLVQNTKDVGYNSKIKMTIAKYYIPSGRCIQSVSYDHGKKKALPDSLRTAFKTSMGRTVYDGGGVLPDVVLPKAESHEMVKALRKEQMIFKFVTVNYKSLQNYCDTVNCHYDDFDAFVQFLDKEKFEYRGITESAIEQLEEKAKKEHTYEQIQGEIDHIKLTLKQMQRHLLEESKEEILRLISQDLAGRKYFAKGKTKQALRGDSEIREVISLLSDMDRYRSILKAE